MSAFHLKLVLLVLIVPMLALSFWPPGRALLRKLSGGILLGLGALSLVTGVVVFWRGDAGLHGGLVATLLGGFGVYAVFVARSLKRQK